MRVLIARITAELPRYHEYYDSLDHLVTPPGTEILPMASSSPAKNRNLIIKAALDEDRYSHVFFTDDDQVYQPNTLMRLLSHEVHIVSGMYCVKFDPFPIIALDNPNEVNMSAFIDMNKYPPNQLVEIPRVPAGCLLVTTSALRLMRNHINNIYEPTYKDKWFTMGHIQPDEWGDDLWFCDRARDAGLKIHMDTGVPCGHITKCVLWPTWDVENKCWQVKFGINEGYRISNARKAERA